MRTLQLKDYNVSKSGEITNLKNGHKLIPQKNGKGYLRVSIGGKLVFVHRLVADLYVPNPDNKPQVNHIDGNKENNYYKNLEWVTNSENRKHAVENHLHLSGEACKWSKLSKRDVETIRSIKYPNITKLSKIYGVSRSTIRDVISFKTWSR